MGSSRVHAGQSIGSKMIIHEFGIGLTNEVALVLKRGRGSQPVLKVDRELRWHPALRIEVRAFRTASTPLCERRNTCSAEQGKRRWQGWKRSS
jgi:hypothetical protein